VLYNVLNQEPADELFPLAKERGYGVIARVPLASGMLSGKYHASTVFPANDVRQGFLTEKRLREAMERVDEVKGIVSGHCRTLGEAALRFVLAHDAVATTVPGARNAHQVEQNVAAAREALPAEIVDRLRARLGDYNFYARHSIRV
jgi:aryl-alcohol dehydrogenase-like predicted oxidoreductase